MITKTDTLEALLAIKVDHSITISEVDLEKKADLLCRDLKNHLSIQQLRRAANKIRLTSQLFGKLPTSGAFLEAAGVRFLSPEEEAELAVDEIMKEASTAFGKIPENKTSKLTIERFLSQQGISSQNPMEKLWWLMFDPDNLKKREPVWVRKELVELWLRTFDSDNKVLLSRDGEGMKNLGSLLSKQAKSLEN